MKTRRILAASTAALLAFGTTAIMSTVASATAATVTFDAAGSKTVQLVSGDTTVDVTIPWTSGATAEDTTAAANKVKVEIDDVASASSVTVSGTTATVSIPVSNANATKVIKVTPAVSDNDPSSPTFTFTGTPVTYTVNVVKYTEAGDDVKIKYNKNGVDLGDGVTMKTASGSDKTFKDWTLSAQDKSGTLVGDSDGIDIETCPVIKGLEDDLKEAFEEVDVAKVMLFEFTLGNAAGEITHTAPGNITLTVNVGSLENANVYHVNGKKLEKLNSKSVTKVSDGHNEVTFTTKSFSNFIITTADIKGATAANNAAPGDTSAATSTADGSTTTNPDTGIALAIAPVVLAAGAVAVVALKKKH